MNNKRTPGQTETGRGFLPVLLLRCKIILADPESVLVVEHPVFSDRGAWPMREKS